MILRARYDSNKKELLVFGNINSDFLFEYLLSAHSNAFLKDEVHYPVKDSEQAFRYAMQLKDRLKIDSHNLDISEICVRINPTFRS